MNNTLIPNDEAILHQLYANALTLRERGDYAKALTVIETLLQAQPEWDLALQLKGDILFELGCTEEAIDAYRNAIRHNPHSPALRERFIALHAQKRAELLMGSTQESQPYAKALAYHLTPELKPLEDNQSLPESVVKAFATHLLDEAFKLDESGNKEDALATCVLALRLAPDNADACNLLGTLYEDMGVLNEALKWYQEASRLDPTFREAQENLEQLHTRLSAQPWVTIARFVSLAEAEIARSRLEVEGIQARVANRALANYFGSMVLADPFHLKVPEYQAKLACDILGIMLEDPETA